MTSSAIFRLDLLKHYQVLDRPGTFMVTVAYNVTETNLYVGDDYPRYLIPLKVIVAENIPKLIKIVDTYTVEFKHIKEFFLTGAIFENDGIDTSLLPIKGEKVLATFDYKNDKLVCTNIKLIDREDLTYVDFSAIDELYKLAEEFLFIKK